MKRIMIIDDESKARSTLRKLCTEVCPDVTVVGEAGSIAEALRGIRKLKPDAILLDIDLEDGSGFDLLDFFPQASFRVIFTTAHDEFALRAFRYNALDYLLKPVRPGELFQALSRLELRPTAGEAFVENHLPSGNSGASRRIALTTLKGTTVLHFDQILYLEADGNYTTFYLRDATRVVVCHSVGEFERMLPGNSFFRIHQSYLVHLDCVHQVLHEDGGCVRLDTGQLLPVARRRREEFLKALVR